MAITFPQDCTTPAERTEYCYRAQELLRLDHNSKGQDYKDEVITEEEFISYRIITFDPKQSQILETMLKQRKELKISTKWIIDIGTI